MYKIWHLCICEERGKHVFHKFHESASDIIYGEFSLGMYGVHKGAPSAWNNSINDPEAAENEASVYYNAE